MGSTPNPAALPVAASGGRTVLVNVNVNNPLVLSRDPAVVQAFAPMLAPYLEQQIGYST